jgi:hypothetical protein
MDPYATHLDALVTVALASEGPILELGCGDYSTPVLAAIARQQGRRFLVQASDKAWAKRYESHAEIQMVNWAAWEPPAGEWGLVFLDSEESTRERIERLPVLATITKTVVLHDADVSMGRPRWLHCTAGWNVALFKLHKPWTAVLTRAA